MKKLFKRRSSSVPLQAGPDTAALINNMQQQLVSLEKKIDILISNSSERPSERKHFSKPFPRSNYSQRPSYSQRPGRGRRDDNPRERKFTQAVCAACKKECEVPFKPRDDRPVYCKDCFSKRKDDGR